MTDEAIKLAAFIIKAMEQQAEENSGFILEYAKNCDVFIKGDFDFAKLANDILEYLSATAASNPPQSDASQNSEEQPQDH